MEVGEEPGGAGGRDTGEGGVAGGCRAGDAGPTLHVEESIHEDGRRVARYRHIRQVP